MTGLRNGRGKRRLFLLTGAVAPVATACVLAGMVTASPAAVAAPQPAVSTFLFGISATSARSAWAVGETDNGSAVHTLIQRWNGRSWQRVPSPNPGDGSEDRLFSVAATSARNAWAVGSYFDGSAFHLLILRWNGRSWRHANSHFPGCVTSADGLTGVTATSATNAWAVGTATSCAFPGVQVTVILHWNGRAWKAISSPDPGQFGGSSLLGATAISGRDAWAVGSYNDDAALKHSLILHWNGRAWRKVPSVDAAGFAFETGLTGVAATSGKNAWAVGWALRSRPPRNVTVTEHWNGTSWKLVPSPNAGGLQGGGLNGVTALSAAAAWSAGVFRDPATGNDQSLIERWNGRSWHRVASPNPGGTARDVELNDVLATSGSNAWAVGSDSLGDIAHALIEHWNGRTWRVIEH
jgi:hypothetical protein